MALICYKAKQNVETPWYHSPYFIDSTRPSKRAIKYGCVPLITPSANNAPIDEQTMKQIETGEIFALIAAGYAVPASAIELLKSFKKWRIQLKEALAHRIYLKAMLAIDKLLDEKTLTVKEIIQLLKVRSRADEKEPDIPTIIHTIILPDKRIIRF